MVMLEPATAALRWLNSYLLFSISLIPLSELGKGRLGDSNICLCLSVTARKGRMRCRVPVPRKCLKWHVFL